MKRTALILILSLVPGLSWAQNKMCPTRPAGDSSNACASTAFVTGGAAANFASPPPLGNITPNSVATTHLIDATELPGLTSSVEGSGFPGLDGPIGGVNWFLYNAPSLISGNASISTLRVDRVPTGTGGSTSLVPAALVVRDSPPANDSFFEWAVNAQNYNSSLASTGSQNVGVAGSIFKIGAATQVGPSWGGFFQAIDQTGVAAPIGGTIGVEANSGTSGSNGGTDPNKQRVIAQFDCTGLSGTHCGRGLFILPQTAGVVIDKPIVAASDTLGNTEIFSVDSAGNVVGQSFNSSGAVPTNSGTCAINNQLGGSTAGSFKANGVCAGGTYVLSMPTAPSGWACTASDLTTPADTVKQSGTLSINSATFTATTAAADLVTFNCVGF